MDPRYDLDALPFAFCYPSIVAIWTCRGRGTATRLFSSAFPWQIWPSPTWYNVELRSAVPNRPGYYKAVGAWYPGLYSSIADRSAPSVTTRQRQNMDPKSAIL